MFLSILLYFSFSKFDMIKLASSFLFIFSPNHKYCYHVGKRKNKEIIILKGKYHLLKI